MNKAEAEALCEAAGASEQTAEALAEMFPKSIEEYTKEDFLDSDKPYEYIFLHKDNKFMQQKLLNKMSEQAKKVGVRNFPTLYKAYAAGQPEGSASDVSNYTDFPAQPLALPCGKWVCDYSGVRTLNEYGGVNWACPHPIMPVARMTNIDTGVEKVKIAFSRGQGWRTVIVDREIISVSNKITSLSKMGIAVTSETARNLVNYFYDIEQMSGELLPAIECVTHLGWIERDDELEFVPYTNGITFDGEAEYKEKFDCIRQKGDPQKWTDCMIREVRHNKYPLARVIFASSLASPLISLLNCNCFWLHLWGGAGSAKTVMMMCAASIWGNPERGKFVTTFYATTVGSEKNAAFNSSMPYFIDELQILDNRKDMDSLIYMLTEGCGKSRGNKQGGLDNVPHWKNCTISTGERPINSASSNGGAVARVIETECKNKFFGDSDHAREVLSLILNNFGFFGKNYIAFLKKLPLETIENIYKGYYNQLTEKGFMDKQVQSGALILTADEIACTLMYCEDTQLTVDEIAPFLKTNEEVSVNARGYEYVCQQIVANQFHFRQNDKPTELWGELDGDRAVYIINSVFVRMCEDGSFPVKPLLSWLGDRNLIRRDSSGRNTVLKRIGGVVTRCVHLTLDSPETCDDLPEL